MINSKGHLFISIGKSIIRCGGCIIGITSGITPLVLFSLFFLGAELFGIAEELVDKR